MSIFALLAGVVKKNVKRVLTKKLTGRAVGTAVVGASLVVPVMPGAGAGLPALGSGRQALGIDGFTKKRRRMNFGNGKATRRAIRRLSGAMKDLQDIQKAARKALPLPKTSRRPPAGHQSRLTHD